MVKKKRIDLENLKFISEDELPPRFVKTPWEEIFSKIPRGKALVLQPDQVATTTARTALRRFQKNGRFKLLYVKSRKVAENKYVTYVVNPSEEAKQGEKKLSENLY